MYWIYNLLDFQQKYCENMINECLKAQSRSDSEESQEEYKVNLTQIRSHCYRKTLKTLLPMFSYSSLIFLSCFWFSFPQQIPHLPPSVADMPNTWTLQTSWSTSPGIANQTPLMTLQAQCNLNDWGKMGRIPEGKSYSNNFYKSYCHDSNCVCMIHSYKC